MRLQFDELKFYEIRTLSVLAKQNPFSTCFTRPGEIPYLLPDSREPADARVEPQRLIERFLSNRCVGQIVGPHGCGKTTLCHLIADELSDRFATVDYVAIRSASDVQTMRYGSSSAVDSRLATGTKLTIIDGAERVSLLQQRMIVSNLTGRRGFDPNRTDSNPDGLLFTSHRRLKFIPVLFSIVPSVSTFARVANYLDPTLEMTEDQLANLFEQSDGNIREAIMLLYDRHESLRVGGC